MDCTKCDIPFSNLKRDTVSAKILLSPFENPHQRNICVIGPFSKSPLKSVANKLEINCCSSFDKLRSFKYSLTVNLSRFLNEFNLIELKGIGNCLLPIFNTFSNPSRTIELCSSGLPECSLPSVIQ